MILTKHFTLDELTFTDHRTLDNVPNDLEIENLRRLAHTLEAVRAALGNRPIVVNSAFRSVAVNAAVGGKPNSQHLNGCAADIRVPGMTPDQVVRAILLSGLEYDQLIREFDRWTHISIPAVQGTPARRQALIIDKTGVRPFS